MKKNNGYKFDVATKTLTVNYKFAAAMNNFDSEEYNIYKRYTIDFPMLKVVVKSGREQKKARYNKRFTYDNMRKYISTLHNANKLLNDFEIVIQQSAPEKSPYKYVCNWFKQTFPNYKDTPIFENKETATSVRGINKEENAA